MKEFNGHTAVNRLNLKIEARQVFALLGPNGAGKTTINLFPASSRPMAARLA